MILAKLALILVVTALTSLTTKADSAIFNVHDLKVSADDGFVVDGSDPFWVLPLSNTASVSEDDIRVLTFSILPVAMSDEELSLELFYNAFSQGEENDQRGLAFDPLYRFNVTVARAELEVSSGKLAIDLPKHLDIDGQPAVRIDLNNCADCALKIGRTAALVSRDRLQTGYTQSNIDNLHNGASSIADSKMAARLSDWRTNDMQINGTNMHVTDGDPYLVSPKLNTDTRNLGGVQFSLTSPSSINMAEYQLFYATDAHGFIEAASSIIQVPSRDGQHTFVVPLDFLSTEQPRARVLKQLRLDFDSHAAGDWQLGSATLIDNQQLADLSKQLPARLLERKLQRAHGLGLVKKAAGKVLNDTWFSLMYFALLILLIIGFHRAYRK